MVTFLCHPYFKKAFGSFRVRVGVRVDKLADPEYK